MLQMNTCLKRNEKIPWRIIEGEGILVNVEKGEIIQLNEVGAYVWKMLDGKKTIKDIINDICNSFDVKREIAKKDILEFLEKVQKSDLVLESKRD